MGGLILAIAITCLVCCYCPKRQVSKGKKVSFPPSRSEFPPLSPARCPGTPMAPPEYPEWRRLPVSSPGLTVTGSPSFSAFSPGFSPRGSHAPGSQEWLCPPTPTWALSPTWGNMPPDEVPLPTAGVGDENHLRLQTLRRNSYHQRGRNRAISYSD
jgi:hypothetical protein